MAKCIYDNKEFKPEQLSQKEFLAMIKDTYRVLTEPLHSYSKKTLADTPIPQEIPPELTAALEQNAFMFAGFKIFHECNEIESLLKGEDGGYKPFYKFEREVEQIDNTYNNNYLRSEYNFATQSTLSAVKWKEYEQDGDRYNLQYRTAADERVREQHAILHNTTLPPSDPFWDKYYPPNGWNCFEKNTEILTVNGWKKIQNIKQGDLLVGGSGNYQFVIGTHINSFDGEIVNIFSKRKRVSCTPNHRFITQRGWIAASEIKTGDILIQVGKIGFFNEIINAIHNTITLIRYGLMSLKTKWKSVASYTINN